MTKGYQKKVQQAIIAEINAGYSGNQIAARIDNCSPATISDIKNGKFAKKSPEMFRRIAAALRIEPQWNMVITENMKKIFNICDDVKKNKYMFQIEGDTRFGKTFSLYHYQRTDTTNYMITCAPGMSKKDLLMAIQKSIGQFFPGSQYQQLEGICNYIVSQENPLLIFDEPEKLSSNALLIIKTIFDFTLDNAGIILSGTSAFTEKLNRGAINNRIGFAELRGRIAIRYSLSPPTDDDIKKMCIANGISTPVEIEQIRKKSNNCSDVRNLIKVELKTKLKAA